MISPETAALAAVSASVDHSNNTGSSSLNCLNLVRKRSGSAHQRRTHPVLQPQQQPHLDSGGQQLPGELQQHSFWGQGTYFSIDWLTSTDSWTNWPANRASRLRERSCRVPLYHIQQMRQKKIWQSDSISSFSPRSLAALWALHMWLQREFSKQGHHFEHRLCATLTALYGSAPRSFKQGCVVRLRTSLSSVLWYGLISLLLLLIPEKIYIPVWIPRCFLK